MRDKPYVSLVYLSPREGLQESESPTQTGRTGMSPEPFVISGEKKGNTDYMAPTVILDLFLNCLRNSSESSPQCTSLHTTWWMLCESIHH